MFCSLTLWLHSHCFVGGGNRGGGTLNSHQQLSHKHGHSIFFLINFNQTPTTFFARIDLISVVEN